MRTRYRSVVVLAVVVLGLVAMTAATTAGTTKSSKSAAGAPAIPAKTIKFGFYPCCADTAVPVVGMKRGFFRDVGITISPENGQQFTQPSQFLPAMQRKDMDIVTAFSTTWLSTLNSYGMDLPPAVLYDIYLGRDILVSPSSSVKSTAEYMKQGMSFKAAAKKAVSQLKGKEVYTDPFAGAQPPYYDVLLSYGGLTGKDLKFQFLADNKILALSATPGRVEFAIPLAAPVLVAMIRGGYKPLIDMPGILKYDPKSSQAAELLKETGNQTVMIQRELWDKDPDTVLRYASVVFRSIDFLKNKKTAPTGNKIVADTINAATGLKLIPADIAAVFSVVDPLFTWEQQGSTLWNPKSVFYAPRGYSTAVQSLIDNKTLPNDTYDLKKFLLAQTVYTKMRALQLQADKLFKTAAKSKKANKALVAKAHKYYEWYDFLDAVRYLKAAMA
jgi:hypothetical protein